MKKALIALLVAFTVALLSAASAVAVYRYAPLWLLEGKQQSPRAGSTITTIQGSDTISASRTTINTNFSNLNTSKAEISDVSATTTLSSLATIGTVTTGTWHGSIIDAQWGGTGSSTLSSNQLLLGNGTGVVKTVAGYGISGQFLTSAGNGAAPTWTTASVDQGIAYTWTGLHTFNATTSIVASSVLAAPLKLNGVSYAFPTSQGASSTVLMTNGSGSLIWATPNFLYASSSSSVQSNASAVSSETATSYTLHKKIFAPLTGTYNIAFDLKCSGGGKTCSGVIYKNAITSGTSRSTTNTSYDTFTEQFNVNAGDSLELWIKAESTATANATNFKLMYDIISTSTPYKVLDN